MGQPVTDSAWVEELFRSIDAKDSPRFLDYLTEDACFRFGNAPSAVGKTAISQLLEGFFASIQALHHDLLNTWTTAEHVICQGIVTYKRHDGSTLCVPFVDVFAMRSKLVMEYLIYIDASQLYPAQSQPALVK